MALAWYNGFPPDQRQRSWEWMKALLDEGTLAPAMTCQACGQDDGAIDYHAEDYSEPFGPHIYAFQLCFRCHMMIHCRFRQPGGWKAYRDAIRAGRRFPPLWRHQFGVAVSQMGKLATVPSIVWAEPFAETVLDKIDAGFYRSRAPKVCFRKPEPPAKKPVSRKPEVCDLPVDKHWPE